MAYRKTCAGEALLSRTLGLHARCILQELFHHSLVRASIIERQNAAKHGDYPKAYLVQEWGAAAVVHQKPNAKPSVWDEREDAIANAKQRYQIKEECGHSRDKCAPAANLTLPFLVPHHITA